MNSISVAALSLAAGLLQFASCQKNLKRPQGVPLSPRHEENAQATMMFIVHGDGNYLYHDRSGNAHRADEEIVREVQRIGKGSSSAEVFLFHQKPGNGLLPLPRKNGVFYYFKQGALQQKLSYHRKSGLQAEVEILHRLTCAGVHSGERRSLCFFYFGHGISEWQTANRTNRILTLSDLTTGLASLGACLRDDQKFDLAVLSSCYSGTTAIIGAISPYVRYVVASPENLHLSHFDLSLFHKEKISDMDAERLAFELASRSFQKLETSTETVVTVAVYDAQKTAGFLQEAAANLAQGPPNYSDDDMAGIVYRDCFEDSTAEWAQVQYGVTVFYRPPRFGKMRNKLRHSGWDCWEIGEGTNAKAAN